jgi:hypothetical protein
MRHGLAWNPQFSAARWMSETLSETGDGRVSLGLNGSALGSRWQRRHYQASTSASPSLLEKAPITLLRSQSASARSSARAGELTRTRDDGAVERTSGPAATAICAMPPSGFRVSTARGWHGIAEVMDALRAAFQRATRTRCSALYSPWQSRAVQARRLRAGLSTDRSR